MQCHLLVKYPPNIDSIEIRNYETKMHQMFLQRMTVDYSYSIFFGYVIQFLQWKKVHSLVRLHR